MDFIQIDYLYLIKIKFNRCVFDDFLNKNYFIVVWKYLVCILIFFIEQRKRNIMLKES